MNQTEDPVDAHALRDTIRRYRLEPKKSLGQNFLVEPWPLGHILAAADLASEDIVLEIGPGLGILTRQLAANAGQVIAVELDDRLIGLLQTDFQDQPQVTIVHGDILSLAPGELVAQYAGNGSRPTYKVVANLPYYITAPVLRHLLEADQAPERTVVMVQREVAERICAQPGQLSILAVSVQFYARPTIVCQVPADAFYPRPKVDSAVLRLDNELHPAATGVTATVFFRIVRAGFGQKRKQLANSLAAGLALPKAGVTACLEEAGIDPQRRAQTVDIEEWCTLYHVLVRQGLISI